MSVPFASDCRVRMTLLMFALLAASTWWVEGADQANPAAAGQPPPAAEAPAAGQCPGKEGPTQYTGKVETRAIPSAVVNGKPMSGTWSAAGARSNWHCHPGGQFLIVMEGVGRAQKRGERVRDLHVGEIEYAGPWVEHWHGAAPHSAGQFLQVALQPTGTRWMEPVSEDDYLGNDNGFGSRAVFLATLKR